MPQDLYHYETMIDRALRGVVREALERAAREGLRGAHHFYIGFATDMKGVAIPDSLPAPVGGGLPRPRGSGDRVIG